MKIKTSKVSGKVLNYLVAQIEKVQITPLNWYGNKLGLFGDDPAFYAPAEDWAQGGPIIEREKIRLNYFKKDAVNKGPFVVAAISTDYAAKDAVWVAGPTPLIAAMRCYCAAKLGDEVEVPNEILV